MNSDSRKVGNIREDIRDRADAETERPGNFQCPHRVLHLVQDVVDVGPASVCVQDFERRGRILEGRR